MTMLSMGVDPGLVDGAAVLLDMSGKQPFKVVNAWTWRRLVRGYQLTSLDGVVMLPSLHAVGAEIRRLAPDGYRLTVEGLYVDDTTRGPSMLALAEATGEVMGPLRDGAVGELQRPVAARWRAKVLRLGRVSAAAAAARAMQCAPVLVDGLGTLASNEHVCEAACIAVYGGLRSAHAGDGGMG